MLMNLWFCLGASWRDFLNGVMFTKSLRANWQNQLRKVCWGWDLAINGLLLDVGTAADSMPNFFTRPFFRSFSTSTVQMTNGCRIGLLALADALGQSPCDCPRLSLRTYSVTLIWAKSCLLNQHTFFPKHARVCWLSPVDLSNFRFRISSGRYHR